MGDRNSVAATSLGRGIAAKFMGELLPCDALAEFAVIWINVVLAAVFLLAVLSAGLFLEEFKFGVALQFLALATLYGLSIAMLGVFVGFLFGVPRVIASSNGENATASTPRAAMQTNTNVERISDWLSAAIVALSLTQIGQIRGRINEIAAVAERVFQCPEASGVQVAASANVALACQSATFEMAAALAPVAAVAMTAIGAVAGMLIGYVSTRVFLTRLFYAVEKEINEWTAAADEVGPGLAEGVERAGENDTALATLAQDPKVQLLATAPNASIRDGVTAKGVADARIAMKDWVGAATVLGIAAAGALLKRQEIETREKLLRQLQSQPQSPLPSSDAPDKK